MKKTLKNEALSGAKMKISIDYNLAIINRIGFISVLIGDTKSTEYSIKKLNKVLEIIEKDKQDKKLSQIYKAYTFIVSILNVSLGNYENRLKEKEAIFREEFFTDDLDVKKNSYLVSNINKDDLIINLNAINNMNYNLSNYASDIIKTLEKAINPNVNNNKLLGNHFITFIVGKYDIINRLSESYCTDKNASKRLDYIKQINNHWKMVYSYIKKIAQDEPLLEADFIKGLLINMFSTTAHSNLYCKDLDMLKTNIKIFDDLIKELNIKDKNTSFELVNKVKGDYWFKRGEYNAAINYYKETINKMKDNDPKKPVVFFNIGCASYLMNNKSDAIQYLNQCISAFRVFEYEKKTFNILVRLDVISRKFNTAKYLLKVLGE
jgi:tetratricopeptide (TPR) repeat protein